MRFTFIFYIKEKMLNRAELLRQIYLETEIWVFLIIEWIILVVGLQDHQRNLVWIEKMFQTNPNLIFRNQISDEGVGKENKKQQPVR